MTWEKELAEPLNPARHLELLVELLLAQRLYAIEFAWSFTVLERHLQAAAQWLRRLPPLSAEQDSVRGLTLDLLESLGGAIDHLRIFAEQADLGALDRGLAAARTLRFPLDEAAARAELVGGLLREFTPRVWSDPTVGRPWQKDWEASVVRHMGESRVTFVCKTCGWDFTYVAEVGSAEELELPFRELECSLCADRKC